MTSKIVSLNQPAFAVDEIRLIPEGEYRLVFQGWRTWLYFGRQPKVALHFKVADFGEYFETPLDRYYNAKKLNGRAGNRGQFSVGRSSDFIREFARVTTRPVARLDRVPMSIYSDALIIGRVSTVVKGHDQKDIPETVQYSVVSEILGVEK